MRLGWFYGMIATVVLSSVAICPSALAQNTGDAFERYRQVIDKRFEKIRQGNEQVFNNYRDKINNDFAQYLEKEWDRLSINQVIPNRPKPEPKPVVDNVPAEESKPLPHVIPLQEEDHEKPQPKPVEPIKPSEPVLSEPKPESNFTSFLFFGNECKIHIPAPKEYSLKGASTEEIGKAWEVLVNDKYNDMLLECLEYRESLALCDWGMYQFLRAFSESYCGDAECNDAVMLQMFILSQLGYRVRLGKQGDQLVNLVAFEQTLFSVPYLILDGIFFYNLSEKASKGGIEICNFTFPGESSASLKMRSFPNLPDDPTDSRTVRSRSYSSASVNVRTNQNLIRFLDTYPGCSWELFAEASLSQAIKDQIYPILREAIDGQSEQKAAGILLNFVQTGFEYQTDDEQFGREKTFFGDETFFYPYCDCEDRSVLFAILVKELLGLDVVLLDYPSHIATAVHFNTETIGDYFNINGMKYIICDPTYIGAPIGKSMPNMVSVGANILKIN